MKKVTFATAYNRKEEFIRDCNTKQFTSPSKVKQSLAYATDINKIYENYCNTGKLPLNGQQPIYDENFVKYDSLIEAQKLVDEASKYFAGLPAKIKNQYGNSLQKFVMALNNQDKFLIDEGLLVPTVKESVDIPEDITDVIPTPTEPSVPSEPVNTATTD